MSRRSHPGILQPYTRITFSPSTFARADSLIFSAVCSSSSMQLHYLTSGKYGGPDPSPLTFTGLNYSYPGYQSIGGQIVATASTTATDSSAVTDCVTFYVEGPEAGIPDPTITGQLDGLYSTGATPNLMTGVAMKESSYQQFRYPGEGNGEPDLFSLEANFGISAKWPTESPDGGSHIGLMMFPISDSDAWDWTTNTNDGINSTSYGFSGADLPLATKIINAIIKGSKQFGGPPGHTNLAALNGVQLENMALVLYGPYANASNWTMQYYAPICVPPGQVVAKGSSLTCQSSPTGGWTWAVNDPSVTPPALLPGSGNPSGVGYADGVRSHLQ